MNIRLILSYIGHIVRVEGVFMLPALVLSLFEGDMRSSAAFAGVMLLLVAGGTLLASIKPSDHRFFAREGFVTVALAWIVISLLGALPFLLSGTIPDFVNALFETVSGFSTTGASILTDVESLPRGIQYWRSFTHWLGGMGVLVFMLAVLPLRGTGGGSSFKLMRAESPGPVVGRLVPKIKSTAMILYAIYVALTVLEIIMLVCGGMPFFDSVINAFGTAGTGGFSIKNASIGAYDSYYLQGVIGVFMLLFGINFNIFYLLLIRDFKSIFKNSELRLYLGVIVVSVGVIAINTLSMFPTAFDAIHHSFFQVASIVTTTGFATVDFNAWPTLSKCVLVFLMFIGACAGSTGGGAKIARVLIVGKSFRSSLSKMIHPHGVKTVTADGRSVSENVISEVWGFMAAYAAVFVVSVLVVAIDGKSFETTITAVLACLNNVGPGLGLVGPTGNYSDFSYLGKLVLSADMLIGRLEIFPILLLFNPITWRRSR